MGTCISPCDHDGLLRIINRMYGIGADEISLHRDLIGRVYFVRGRSGRYVLKLYRCHHTENALSSVPIIQYLKERGYPVAPVIPARTGGLNMWVDTPDGRCAGVLYDYIEGVEPDLETEIADIGRQVGLLHEIMREYPRDLRGLGKAFYIDRYISMLRHVGYVSSRVDELERLGCELWIRMERLPSGFCHGDLHTGNMLRTVAGDFVLFDFDAASLTHSAIDVATICDCTDFNHLQGLAYDDTLRRLAEFYEGYGKVSTVTSGDVEPILAFIAIRHYEIIATILSCEGVENLSRPFMDEQYEWLLKWEEVCQKRGFS